MLLGLELGALRLAELAPGGTLEASRLRPAWALKPLSRKPPISRYSSIARSMPASSRPSASASTIKVSSLACCASSIQWWRSRLLNRGIEIAVVLDAVEIVKLRHPLDVEDHQGDGERIVAEDLGGDRLGRADDRAFGLEALGEQPVELLEQVDVLGFLAGELARHGRDHRRR